MSDFWGKSPHVPAQNQGIIGVGGVRASGRRPRLTSVNFLQRACVRVRHLGSGLNGLVSGTGSGGWLGRGRKSPENAISTYFLLWFVNFAVFCFSEKSRNRICIRQSTNEEGTVSRKINNMYIYTVSRFSRKRGRVKKQ